jgi:hypothetical protein
VQTRKVIGAVLLVCIAVAGTLLAFFYLDYFALSRGEEEIHLLPEGFEGPVVIVFNKSDGQPKEYERKKRVYRIPPNGVLKTQFAESSGTWKWRNAEYFYVGKDGSRAPIPYDPFKKLPADSTRIEVQANSVGTGEAKRRDGAGNIFQRYAVAKNQNAGIAQEKMLGMSIGDL